MPHNARIEQRRCFERIFMKKICADQAALRLIERGMGCKRFFHVCGARLEYPKEVPVATFEILQHVIELLRGQFGIEPQDPVDNMIGTNFVGWIEVARLSRRFKGSDDHSGGIRAQV